MFYTITNHLFICDVCGETQIFDKTVTFVSEVIKLAEENEWHHVKDKDYCPKCSKKVVIRD